MSAATGTAKALEADPRWLAPYMKENYTRVPNEYLEFACIVYSPSADDLYGYIIRRCIGGDGRPQVFSELHEELALHFGTTVRTIEDAFAELCEGGALEQLEKLRGRSRYLLIMAAFRELPAKAKAKLEAEAELKAQRKTADNEQAPAKRFEMEPAAARFEMEPMEPAFAALRSASPAPAAPAAQTVVLMMGETIAKPILNVCPNSERCPLANGANGPNLDYVADNKDSYSKLPTFNFGSSEGTEWHTIQQTIRPQIPEGGWLNWVQHTKQIAFDGGVLLIAAPNADTKQWIEGEYLELIRRELPKGVADIVFVVQEEMPPPPSALPIAPPPPPADSYAVRRQLATDLCAMVKGIVSDPMNPGAWNLIFPRIVVIPAEILMEVFQRKLKRRWKDLSWGMIAEWIDDALKLTLQRFAPPPPPRRERRA